MAKMNLQTRFAKALEARGQTRVEKRAKYLVFTRSPATEGRKPTFYYLGTAGSLRFGVNFTTSRVASDAFRDQLLTVTADQA